MPSVPSWLRLSLPLAVLLSLPTPALAATSLEASSRLRGGNFSSSAGPVQLEVDGRPVGRSLAYGEVSEYVVVEPGAATVVFRAADAPPSAAPVATVQAVLGPGASASAFLSGGGRVNADVVLDDHSAPAVGRASVRILNLAPGLPAASARLRGGIDLADGIPYRGSAPSVDVPAEPHDVEVLPAEGGPPVLTVRGLTLRAGTVYTLVVAGGVELPVDLTAVVDATGSDAPPAGGVPAGLGGVGAETAFHRTVLAAVVAVCAAAGALLAAARGAAGRPARPRLARSSP